MSERDDNHVGGTNTGVVVKTKPKTKKPSMYKVLMLNDDYTPMEFVVHVLERFFSKGREEATRIMMHVHRRGVGICGIFPYEIAET
ncbi:MAG: ATP-dependent Clp protease adaptor ClpS, partial [Alphaproteobacteria bacterium]